MNEELAVRSRRSRGLAFVLWVTIGAILWSVVTFFPDLEPIWGRVSLSRVRRLLEVWLLIGVLGIALHDYPRRRAEAEGGAPAMALAVILLGGLLYGQYVGPGGRQTYPVTDWGMYTTPVAAVSFLTFDVALDDGTSVPLPISQAVPTASPRAFMQGLRPHASAASNGSEADQRIVSDAVTAIVAAAEIEDAVAVTIRRCSVTSEPDGGVGMPNCDDLLLVPLEAVER